MHLIVLIGGLSTPNILTIITIALVILVPAVHYFAKRRRRMKALYEIIWKKSTRLKPSEIMGNRAVLKDGFHEYYRNREEDIQLEDLLKEGKNTILIGNPLAGKSRTIYQAMKDADKPYSVLIPKVTDIISVDFRKPIYWKFWRKKILILDDLNKFVQRHNFTYFLNEFTQQNKSDITILATCRTEPEYEKLNPEILGIFEEKIMFKRFPDDQAKYVAKKTGRKLPDRYDGNIGSIFVDIIAVRDRYNTASKEETSMLRATRRLYEAGIYEGKQLFKYERIKTVCENIFGLKLEKYQFDEIIDKLIRKGFVLRRKEFIWIEETYFDRVIEDELDILANLNEMIAIFSNDAEALFKIGTRAAKISEETADIAPYIKLAIRAYHKALRIWTIENSKHDYAITHTNLGNAYTILSGVENPVEYCELAIKAFSEALKIHTFDKFPIDFAIIQSNLGNAYRVLSEAKETKKNCHLAITACKEALNVLNIDKFPWLCAGAFINLGVAHGSLSMVENKSDNCKLAIGAFTNALKIYTKDRYPIDYALTQCNLGNAYRILSDDKNQPEICKQAINAYSEALKIRTIDRFPRQYAETLANLGGAFTTISRFENKTENRKHAIETLLKALKILTIDKSPILYADIQNNLGTAYRTLAAEEEKTEDYRQAIRSYKEALRVRTLERFPGNYAVTQTNLGDAYLSLAKFEDRANNCILAISAYNEALKVRTLDQSPIHNGITQNNLGAAFWTLAEEVDKRENCGKARIAFEEALRVYQKENLPQNIETIKENLRRLQIFSDSD